jgi:hypothetical protein
MLPQYSLLPADIIRCYISLHDCCCSCLVLYAFACAGKYIIMLSYFGFRKYQVFPPFPFPPYADIIFSHPMACWGGGLILPPPPRQRGWGETHFPNILPLDVPESGICSLPSRYLYNCGIFNLGHCLRRRCVRMIRVFQIWISFLDGFAGVRGGDQWRSARLEHRGGRLLAQDLRANTCLGRSRWWFSTYFVSLSYIFWEACLKMYQ